MNLSLTRTGMIGAVLASLVLGSVVGSMLLAPHATYAAQNPDNTQQLGITCDNVDISGNTWTISGTWKAYNFPGQSGDYDIKAFSPATVIVDPSSKDAPDTFVTTQGPTNYVGTVAANVDMEGTWSNVLTFASTPTYLAAALYHAQPSGNEQSADSFCTFTLPQCSDGVDNTDSEDTLIDAQDPGCMSGPNNTYNPEDNDETDPAPTTGTLTLLKELVKDNGGTAADTAWTLSASGPTNISGVEGNASVTNAVVAPGSYDLSESGGPSGYTASDWVCTGGSQSDGNTVSIDAGDAVTCTITNDDVPVPPAPACSDGSDNDEDEYTDYPYDPGCSSAEDDSETDEPSDMCPNIEGTQENLPEGYVVLENGDCAENAGSGGGSSRRSGGEVLGATTEAVTCSPLLTDYLKFGWANNSDQVSKLQGFLNDHMGSGLPVTGFFGELTMGAVKAFQTKYGTDVLKPWIGFPASGITGENTPTGYVYQTTKWQINNLWCPGSEAFPSPLI